MGFGNGKFAKIWKLEDKGNYHVAEMSTSKKNKQSGDYETDFSNKFVRLIGQAHNQAKSLKDGDRVKIGDCEVTNNYDKEKKTTYTNYAIFSFVADDDAQSKPTPKDAKDLVGKDGFMDISDGIDEELPFN